MSIVIAPYDSQWPARAARLIEELSGLMGPALVACHHIGSTAVPGLAAKPIIDLLPVVTDHAALTARRSALEAAGYEWMGPYGLPGRRYLRRDLHGKREVHCHAYVRGDTEITRHLAFRNHLRANPTDRAAYEAAKLRCATTSADMAAYCDCKDAVVARIEATALAALA